MTTENDIPMKDINVQKLFNEDLPGALVEHLQKMEEVNAKFQFIIPGDGGGEWFVDLTKAGMKVSPGQQSGADCTITVSSEDFRKLRGNPQAFGMQLFFSGKLKIAGNQMLAMKLHDVFLLAGS